MAAVGACMRELAMLGCGALKSRSPRDADVSEKAP
jgi:hypothetical protein